VISPSNRLEKLSGDRAGQYSIRINDQWRICFERLRVHSSRLAAFVVIPAEAGIQKKGLDSVSSTE
jgi:plasmid maintenance system killer protein